jgi:hypothetical protein
MYIPWMPDICLTIHIIGAEQIRETYVANAIKTSIHDIKSWVNRDVLVALPVLAATSVL